MVSVAADILHTVGPVDGSERKLRSCYTRCLQLTLENKIQSVVSEVHTRMKFAGVKFAVVWFLLQAFCCIATGVYGELKCSMQEL